MPIPKPLTALLAAAPFAVAPALHAQTGATPIGHTSAREVQVAGAVDMHNGEMELGNGSTVTAGSQAVKIALTRGGDLRLCSTTSVHLSHDRSIDAPDSTALMLALDRGAIEANYTVGKYSDVLLTPDLRILISGPGDADLQIRVGSNGDTCLDNRGLHAPYITVSSQLEGGLYRVQPNQHVMFEHGSLREVVDTEASPCGCPAVPVVSVASAGTPSANPAQSGQPGQPIGGPSSTTADTAFPIAISEGLATPPPPPTTPVAAPGEVHAQVLVPFSYSGVAPAAPPTTAPPVVANAAPAVATPPKAAAKPASAALKTPVAPAPASVAPAATTSTVATPPPASVPEEQSSAPSRTRRIFRKVGRFFSRFFGAES